MKNPELWYSYTLKPYILNEPKFFDPSDFEWTKILEANFDVIKQETESFLKEKKLTPYFNESLSDKKDSWKTSGMLHWGLFEKKNYPYFKKTWDCIKAVPGLVSFSVSSLNPGSEIKEHNGDTNAIIRVHLPIIVPSDITECSFTVGNETRAWEEGKVLLFNDAHLHSAKNLSNRSRVVLILDIIRPEFISRQKEISAKVLNGLIWQWMTQAYPGIRKYPMFFKQGMWSSIRFCLRLLLRYHRAVVWP